MRTLACVLLFNISFVCSEAQQATYAERLGFPKGARVVILHVDDVGMSWDSNQGAIEAMENSDIKELKVSMRSSENDISVMISDTGMGMTSEVIAKAFPEFTPGQTINAEWTWEMRQSGSLPPGAQLWWRW